MLLARLARTCAPGFLAATCTPPLDARGSTVSGSNPASALAASSEPQSACKVCVSAGSGHGCVWSSITSTSAPAASKRSTVCEPMKPAPPLTATRVTFLPLRGGGQVGVKSSSFDLHCRPGVRLLDEHVAGHACECLRQRGRGPKQDGHRGRQAHG